MDAIRKCCAGLDVHQESITACILDSPLDRKPKPLIKNFGTTTRELLQLQDWLAEHKCTEVAMESTGVYWKSVWNILESSCILTLANPAHIKNMPGRKTDVKDAQWIAQLHRCGLVQASMVPAQDIRDLRDRTRYRQKIVHMIASEKNRIHKLLQDANIKLTTFVSDLFGISGRALLEKLMDGEMLDEEQVRDLVKTKLKKKVPQLVDALNGKVRLHHREMIRMHMDTIKFLEKKVEELEQSIQELLKPYEKEVELLETIPGIKTDAAASIIAEIGTNMDLFQTEAHLASWAGICPGNNESAGVKKKAKSRKGNKHLKAMLCQSVWAINRKKDCRITSFFHRVKRRQGEKKAAMATAHLYLKIIYYILSDKVEYRELGTHYLPDKKERSLDQLKKQIEKMGYAIQLEQIQAS
ncbi:IS110 family transposase [Bacillus sp. APMAM]|nr:IS110 family transposase [Bacillus sp. APMAM]MBB2483531.1 IS110 family transposase [Bacillus sp. APMAM]RTZ53047.1 IS110 family transposase [Bacillus sp. SAJ1]RTZ53048.1 IS110 family transposase [Bacillus sp. SAJ1]